MFCCLVCFGDVLVRLGFKVLGSSLVYGGCVCGYFADVMV